MSLSEQLELKDGERLRRDSSREIGPLANIDIVNYSVLDAQGDVVGKVEYTEDTAIKGFKVTRKAVRTDLEGKIVLQKFW
ncbi:hypothetical protein [Stenotrophomonas muris]|uniref:hypothetical protein n=1 Tax=Stenotrophomonas muris TaxID=2963283 RepID=UPI002E78A2C6|nr:hypothetical protein [Stenotrophomonas muris]